MNKIKSLIAELDRIDCQLSPENLHCDGEISHVEAARRARTLLRLRSHVIVQLVALGGVDPGSRW